MSTNRPSDRPRIALIAGPTASGKSARAIALAERENGTVINADASQVYRDLRILSARPSAEDEARVPHLLFGYRDGADPCSAAEWAEDAKAAIVETRKAGRLPILVGGSGLYIRTLLDGIAPVPEIDPVIRSVVRLLSAGEAHAALAKEDAVSATRLHPNDTARLHRALEVVRSTGKPIHAWRESLVGGIADTVHIDLEHIVIPVADLYARCDARVDQMIAAGAIAEAEALRARRLDTSLPVMRAIGVSQLIQYLKTGVELDEAVASIKQATRNYAKRQRTWLRHQLPQGVQAEPNAESNKEG
jgi:tRNA dimethylallyltransferase